MLQEWEVLVLAKLNWNIPSVVAIDFVEHIVQVLVPLLQPALLSMMPNMFAIFPEPGEAAT